MTTLRVSLDDETYSALMVEASRHVRPLHWHIKVMLRQALGLEFPYPDMEKPCPLDANRAQKVVSPG
jgi:plasmid stability protein